MVTSALVHNLMYIRGRIFMSIKTVSMKGLQLVYVTYYCYVFLNDRRSGIYINIRHSAM
jgi:hypothetical protein